MKENEGKDIFFSSRPSNRKSCSKVEMSKKKKIFFRENYYSELLILQSLFPTILHNEIYKHLIWNRQHGAGEEANKMDAWIQHTRVLKLLPLVFISI